jgi:hypothetical protein
MKLNFRDKFNLVYMSYMLFYLDESQLISLSNKIQDLLDDNGKIIICQYFFFF